MKQYSSPLVMFLGNIHVAKMDLSNLASYPKKLISLKLGQKVNVNRKSCSIYLLVDIWHIFLFCHAYLNNLHPGKHKQIVLFLSSFNCFYFILFMRSKPMTLHPHAFLNLQQDEFLGFFLTEIWM